MINRVHRLISPKQFRSDFVNEKLSEDEIVIRPTYLSICAADQRYYQGNRSKEALAKKLPMALIHEAVGEVVYDSKNEYKTGTKVVMIPNTPTEKNKLIKENYLRSSYFKSSGFDGFMQDLVLIDRTRVIEFAFSPKIAVLAELTSVAINACDNFKKVARTNKEVFGIWGSGAVGYIQALMLKALYPDAKVIVFSKSSSKLNYFSFVDETYTIDNIPEDTKVDHAFECVGGANCEDAINQIIDIINPQGTINLLGVSENNIPINTRMVLEKGLTVIGHSRSGYDDFAKAIKIMSENEKIRDYLNNIISDEVAIHNINDVHKAFDIDVTNEFKTIMKWSI